jgi:uncharacterized 2Fe-2S/4Fe-4S cluster protein (DUF4445 family)
MNSPGTQNQPGYTAAFEPGGRTVKSLPGENLLDCARRAGVRISSICGGRGLCKSCVVRITGGTVPAASRQDEQHFSADALSRNWRRACQTVPSGDCRIKVSDRAQATPTRIDIEAEDVWVRPDPVVRTVQVEVESVSDTGQLAADDRRFLAALNAKWPGIAHGIDFEVLRRLPKVLRDSGARIDAHIRFGEVIGVTPSARDPLPGLAVDVGTTNIGVLLVDMRTGKTLGTRGIENPQIVHGGDVITRIGHARRSPEALGELRRLAVDAINSAATGLCEEIGSRPERIGDVVVAGNTTMHHLLMGLPVDWLGSVPFVPAVSGATNVRARDMGINSLPGAYVYMLPNIAGFVGGDHTAVLLATDAEYEQRTLLILDIGTNTEISLLHNGSLNSVSCPSGPAFEGGHISCGMRSAPGAIESVRIDDGELQIQCIGDAPPVGICGSGVLDITAQLRMSGIVDADGRMQNEHSRVRMRNGQREFVLVEQTRADDEPVVFTQKDVRAIQLAKGSVTAGIRVLLESAGLDEQCLDQVVIAGAFGNYIDLNSAITIGLLPRLPTERYAQIGDAAAMGAKLALVSHAHRSAAEQIGNGSNYIELSGSPGFNSVFMKSIKLSSV